MQLTIRATGDNVKAVSYLLSKNPANVYERNQKGHLVRLFYSRFEEQEVEVTMFVTPDPLEIVKNSAQAYDITHYINDREFAVSSIFCSFIRTALGTALNGQPKEEYMKWVSHPFSFEFELGPVVSSLSDQQVRDLFEPIGYDITISRPEIDYSFHVKAKSTARYLTLKGTTTLQQALRQLFVLIPVMDNYKHYYIDEKEIEKLERYGDGWLDHHPLKAFILRQALRFKEIYSQVESEKEKASTKNEAETAKKVRLNDLRYEKVVETVRSLPTRQSIVDFGSGEGKLSVQLGFVEGVTDILAVEPSEYATLQAIERFEKAASKSTFVTPTPLWGSLFYYDERLKEKDVMILCEVIEHIEERRLPKIMDTILGQYKPRVLIVTTPNKEYNDVYDMVEHMRHHDHRFEWTRSEFETWCASQIENHPYDVQIEGIGDVHEEHGYPTQMCIFVRKEVRS
ncbi:3' terminal RNA ribose 2'-O-methyltransferase Hen1 [Metabacillus iocasae]|uniref:Small RNA 2'-O-methyltransferase n=1 Tax=Priestia iocasae TaxID=2291674 RepID=A0ABS2QRJ7_9BACI|nr:3' terminal RNA ribose 2'-O-methyltransferase Hen1 [Metabacillus iocasae]MBM7702085.1 3' terminal RNA ribose 2'-O-methyltransferase Hen1 [Metabacillus iocasae]